MSQYYKRQASVYSIQALDLLESSVNALERIECKDNDILRDIEALSLIISQLEGVLYG